MYFTFLNEELLGAPESSKSQGRIDDDVQCFLISLLLDPNSHLQNTGIWMYLENTSFRRKVSGRVFSCGSCGYFCGRISFLQVCRATFLAAAKCETSQRGGTIFLPRINGLIE